MSLLFLCQTVNGQSSSSSSSTPSLQPSIPASPQATAFQKVGEYTVNNASGTPDISIPLYELDHHGFKIPITLRYMPTPLKPGYNYDVTGHGWTLSLGSCVSRTIESWPDENFDFKLNVAPLDKTHYYVIDGNRVGEIIDQCDLGRDRFSVTLPDGGSFQFVITNDGKKISVITSDVAYDVKFERSDKKNIRSFTVTDNSGVQYLFDNIELCKKQTRQDFQEEIAWYLSRITIPNVSSPICFYYDKDMYQINGHGATEPMLIMRRLWTNPGDGHRLNLTFNKEDTWTNYQTKLLTSINFGSTQVELKYTDEDKTTDYNNLKYISIKDYQEEVQRISFNYRIHYPSGPVALLEDLVITGNQGSTDRLVYRFENHSARSITGTDHWGYGNHAGYNSGDNLKNIANLNLYTEYRDFSLSSTFDSKGLPFHSLPLAQYEIHLMQKAKLMSVIDDPDPRSPTPPEDHGILKTIYYPTGGKTEFVFENHRFVTATDANGDYIATKKKRRITEAGGFRIKSIVNYTADGHVSGTKEYKYGPTKRDVIEKGLNLPVEASMDMDEHIGYGEPVVDPTILTYTQIKSSDDLISIIPEMLICTKKGQNFDYSFYDHAGVYGHRGYQCSFSPLNFRSLVQGRDPVVYSEITEYHRQPGDVVASERTAGKTVREFQIYDDAGSVPDSVYNVPLRYQGNTLLVVGSIFKKDYLTRKTDYSYYYHNGKFLPNVVQEESYGYFCHHRTVTSYILDNNFDIGWYPYRGALYTFRIGYQCNDVSLGDYKLTHKTVIRDGIMTTENYKYGTSGLLEEQSSTGTRPHTTTYTYPLPSSSGIEATLWNRHMYSSVLGSHTQSSGSSTWDASGYKMEYNVFDNGQLQPSKLRRMLIVDGKARGYDDEVEVLSYSSNGNPTEVVDRSGMHTVYLWGYDDRYLIAEIKNANMSAVRAAMSSVSDDVSRLRTCSSLAGAEITTWTYKPLVGVTSQTNASGLTTYYDYDGLGRLKEIYFYEDNVVSSGNKRILNQYNYQTITRPYENN
jgi:YD repeat-containing protein